MSTTSLISKIGNTPLIYLKKASEISGCKIFGKAEFLNPGESVKDRAALYILNDAIKNNKLKKGGTIVEGTAGNTGIGIAIIAKELGIKTVIVIPETQSKEKKDTLRELGAELIEVPAVPYENSNNYVKYAKKLQMILVGIGGINLIIPLINKRILKQPRKKFGHKLMEKLMDLFALQERAEQFLVFL